MACFSVVIRTDRWCAGCWFSGVCVMGDTGCIGCRARPRDSASVLAAAPHRRNTTRTCGCRDVRIADERRRERRFNAWLYADESLAFSVSINAEALKLANDALCACNAWRAC
jgi:hypothetical protein